MWLGFPIDMVRGSSGIFQACYIYWVHQTGEGGSLAAIRAMGSSCKQRWSCFTHSPAAHLLLLSWLPNRPRTNTGLWPRSCWPLLLGNSAMGLTALSTSLPPCLPHLVSDTLSSGRGSAPKSKGQLREVDELKAVKERFCYFSFLIHSQNNCLPGELGYRMVGIQDCLF